MGAKSFVAIFVLAACLCKGLSSPIEREEQNADYELLNRNDELVLRSDLALPQSLDSSLKSLAKEVQLKTDEVEAMVFVLKAKAASNQTVSDAASNQTVSDAASNQTVSDAASNQTVSDAASNQTVSDAASNQTVSDAASNQTVSDAASNQTVSDAASNQTKTVSLRPLN
ncbi:hypothetical protein OJAV_G00009310 [Oryzias javanicus]|uniref:Uncharacterized protein n=1 Tax=Oryzias javanicus TaxID=123683 RepID=A0A3S2N7W1_ORYJA|nr:hypothetical protein OJAV_G00009310 [Oryzias javanicus]